jgi:4,5-DOPA dioxygenase extradiol
LFIGHGSPMNAIEDHAWTRAQIELGRTLPKPRAVLCISAHWYLDGTWITATDPQKTIHDFGGFPDELYRIEYPARGDAGLAGEIAALLESYSARPSQDWGLDHGAWSVLLRLFPQADVPVLQLGMDRRLPAKAHLQIGRALRPLRERGVLILGSGNITHNLPDAFAQMRAGTRERRPWADAFDTDIARALERHDHEFLCRALDDEQGRRAHPSPDHYLPLLYAVGAADANDPVRFPVTGFDLGSISMRSVRYG